MPQRCDHSEAVNKLEDELGRIFTVTKTHHYEQGQKYGHLASAIPESKYRLVIGNATWVHNVPANPGTYSQAALGAGNAAPYESNLWRSTRSYKRATMTTLASKRRERS
jgi:hypothetical protein